MNPDSERPEQARPPLDDRSLEALQRRLQPSPRRMACLRVRFLLWRITHTMGGALKRVMDVTVAGTALLLLMPFLLVVAALIKLTDGGPVLFWQTRVGKWGRPFPFPKLRSMRVDAEEIRARLLAANQHGSEGVTFKMKHDPRVTWIGRFIRKTSIDELPQLWCVIKGDMSLVGPRPALVSEVDRYTLDNRRRLDITPGLTCIWQVSGRSDISFDEQCRLDEQYIQEQSLMADVRLLFKTISAVITGRGAY